MTRKDEQRALGEGLAGTSYDELQAAWEHWGVVTDEDLEYGRHRADVLFMSLVSGVPIAAMLVLQIWWLSLVPLVPAVIAIVLGRRWDVSRTRGNEIEARLAAAEARYLEMQSNPYAKGEAA